MVRLSHVASVVIKVVVFAHFFGSDDAYKCRLLVILSSVYIA